MPIVEVHLLEGYDSDDKRRLGEALTDAVRFVIPAPSDAVTVLMHETKAEAYMRGRMQRQPAPASSDPVEIIRDYRTKMEQRDLEAAGAMLADDFTMQFPGAAPMTSLEELVAWSKPRYRSVRKCYDGFDAMQSSDDVRLVYCFGTLSGEWLDGTSFEGIRFIDRFEVVGDKIGRQDVWNDMGEVKAHA